jgi:hypothetical protein
MFGARTVPGLAPEDDSPALVLVMVAFAICAVIAAQFSDRPDPRSPARPDDIPRAEPGLILLTIRETKLLLASSVRHSRPPLTGWNGGVVTTHFSLVHKRAPGRQVSPGQLSIERCRTS